MECASLFRSLGDPTSEINCRAVTGRAEAAQGRYPEAIASYTKALAVARAHKLAEAHISLLNNLGSVDYFLGRYDQAFRNYLEAQTMLPAYASEPWFARRRTVTLANQAALYQRLGQYGKALQVYSQLRSTTKPLLSIEKGQVLENTGTLFRRLGDPYKAVSLYAQARSLFETAGDTAGQISVSKNTGIALAIGLGRREQAYPWFRQALDLAHGSGNDREVAQAALYLGETLRQSSQNEPASQMFRQALLTARKLDSSEDEWKALYGLGQLAETAQNREGALGFYLQAVDRIEHIRATAGPPALRTGFLADKRDVYDGAIRLLLTEQPAPVPRIFQLLERAKARSFQDALRSVGPAPDLHAVSAALPPNTLLLDYWMSEDQLAVIWIRRTGSGILHGKAPSLSATAQFPTDVASRLSSNWRAKAAELSRTVLPMSKLDAERLVIIPDGLLQSLPFDLLTVPGSANQRLLIEDFSLSYLPSAALLLSSSLGPQRWFLPWQTVLEGFADPKPGPTDPAGTIFPADSHDLLSSSANEIISAAGLLRGRANLHIGLQNRKQFLLQNSTRAVPVLHLATHAVADSDDPDRSRILFSPAAPGAPADYLFAREIYGLNLQKISLVMLSACDTESGVTTRGEGIQSFSRALLAAGAHSSVTTLWRVGDLTGKAFSDRFYAHLSHGEPASDALRAAKLEFYRSKGPMADPAYWSLYLLNGNPLTTVPRTIPWSAVLAPIPLLAAGVLLTGILSNGRSQKPKPYPPPGPR